MAYSHLPYPSNPSLEQLKVLATDSVIYLSPSGNDGTGDGSLAKPYRTLQKCMDVARTYTIVGSATLYIRFLRGEYTLTGTIDLYHPQGGNLIIEGDPDAFQQRTLFQVESYNWSLQNFAGGGHTGTVRLWDGVTSGDATMHGFTGQDQGMYFTITNAAIGSRDGYVQGSATRQGVSSLNNGSNGSYTHLFHGDRFFNHGFSYEEGEGILGIGRVLAATADTAVMTVQFQNINIDTRCLVHNLSNGGLGNINDWAGVGSNYPENQYSQPVGYYGSSSWEHDTDPAKGFPQKSTTTSSSGAYITPDPYLLSTYPVVLRSDYSSNTGTLLLKNGILKAIRNIFFASNNDPYTVNGTTGATLNYSQALSAITDQGHRHGGNGTALVVENGSIGIRHLGFYGVGTALSAYGSKVYAYYDNTGYTGSAPISSQGGLSTYAKQNTIDNSPILCTTQCKHGIVSKNSTIDFSNSSGLNRNNGIDYRHNGSYISTTSRSVELFSTTLRANSMHINCDSDVPKFTMRIVVPIFPGMTSPSGGSASFTAFEDNNSGTMKYWQAFPTAKVFIGSAAAGTDTEIAYVNYVKDLGSISGSTVVQGGTAGAGISYTSPATDFRIFDLYGWRISPNAASVTESLKYMTLNDIRIGITQNNSNAGGTLSVRFYKDAAATGVSAEYIVSKGSVLVSGFNGVRQGYINMQDTTSPSGVSAAPQFVNLFKSSGSPTDPAIYMNSTANALSVLDQSSVLIEKSLNITNGGYIPVDVRGNSTLTIGDAQTSTIANGAVPSYVPTDNSNIGMLSVRNYGKIALSLFDNCQASIGVVFAKHPLHGDGAIEGSTTSPGIETLRADQNSRIRVGGVYSVGVPGNTTIRVSPFPLFTTRSGTLYGMHNITDWNSGIGECFINARNHSTIILSSSASTTFLLPESVFLFDGGAAPFLGVSLLSNTSSKYNITKAGINSFITVYPTSAVNFTSTAAYADQVATSSSRIIHMPSAVGIVTRANIVYNKSGLRQWKGLVVTTSGLNIGKDTGVTGLTFTHTQADRQFSSNYNITYTNILS
tara:strand:+ start:363 stop:3512 length:3150 start_codon:yes stop_codon:yes gene_type:complete